MKYVLALLLLLSASLGAKEEALPIQLQAERGSYDAQTGMARYEGQVVIQQGEMELRGDAVNLYFEQQKLVRIEALGKPARFQYRPKKAELIKGAGERLHYDVKSKKISIEGKAHLQQGKNELRASHLDYDLRQEYVRSQKVKLIFYPEQ